MARHALRPTRVLALVTPLAVLLAACGSGHSASPTTTPVTTSPSSGSTGHPVVEEWGRPGGGTSERDPGGSETNAPGGGRGSKSGHHQRRRPGPRPSATRSAAAASESTATVADSTQPGGAQARHTTPTPVSGIQGTVVEVSTSNSDGYALTSAGTVWAWGAGATGELGVGTRTVGSATAVEVHFPAGVRITSLPDPMPYDGGLAIDSQGRVWGWGDDTFHQLCLSSPDDVTTPVQLPLSHVTAAAGASRHTIFDAGGRIEGCGWNNHGDLGDATTTGYESHPTPVQGLPSGSVKAVTASWGNEGVLYGDGDFYDWGFDAAGQVGNGSTTDVARAVHVALPHPAVQVSEGASTGKNGTTLARLSDGSTWLWGDGSQGQLGDGTTGTATTPRQLDLPSGVHFTDVNSGGSTCYGLDQQGRMWSWGGGSLGQLGTGHTSPATRPVDTGIHLRAVSSTAAEVVGLEG